MKYFENIIHHHHQLCLDFSNTAVIIYNSKSLGSNKCTLFLFLFLFIVEQALKDFNMQLSLGDQEATFTALKAVVKLVDANAFLFQPYADRYYEAFNSEKKEGLPGSVLVRYH